MSNKNQAKKQPVKWAKDSGTIVKLLAGVQPRRRSSTPPFYCRIISIEYVQRSLAEIVTSNKPQGSPWLRRNAAHSLEDRQRMMVNYRDAHRASILIIQLLPLGVLPVLTAPSKSYDTNERFYVPWTDGPTSALGKRYVAHDFQMFKPAGERYCTEMANLVAMSRSLLPRWLPHQDASLVPPPPQFADVPNQGVTNPWMWRRLQRNDTITLYDFPSQQDQPIVHKYAGQLPRKHP